MAERRTLNLRTALAPERDIITIDDQQYELRAIEELSIMDRIQVEKVHNRIEALFAAETLPEIDERLERDVRNAIPRLVVDLPESVEARIPWTLRVEIIAFFWMGVAEKRKATPKPPAASGKTKATRTKSSSRGSSASTAATPKAGSESPLHS